MTFKFLNTIIDDLFAFVIKMPTLHRLSVFRDGRRLTQIIVKMHFNCLLLSSSSYRTLDLVLTLARWAIYFVLQILYFVSTCISDGSILLTKRGQMNLDLQKRNQK